jgi:hypothetical protein
VHMYSPFSTDRVGPQTVRQMYVWDGFAAETNYNVTATEPFPQVTEIEASVLFRGGRASDFLVINSGTINGGALFLNARNGLSDGRGTINGSAMLVGSSGQGNFGTINGDGWFYGTTRNGTSFQATGTVNGNAKFFQAAQNRYSVEGGATFRGGSVNVGGRVGQLAEFFDNSRNFGGQLSSASFYDTSGNNFYGALAEGFVGHFFGSILGNAVFRDNSFNDGAVGGSAEFSDNSINAFFGIVRGTSTFNDAACSVGFWGFIDPVTQECTRFFGPTGDGGPESVICNGSAPKACDFPSLIGFLGCGCG